MQVSPAESATEDAAGKAPAALWRMAAGLFVGLMVAYQVNGGLLQGNDAKPNVYLAAQIVERGKLAFTPEEFPFMFVWRLRTNEGLIPDIRFTSWDEEVPQIGAITMRQLYERGFLVFGEQMYYLVPSVRDAEYVNTFGPGAAITALPVFATAKVFSGDLLKNPGLLWYVGKLAASMMVAGSAVCIFLTAAGYTTRWRAMVVAAAYGLGTCVWSISSQALWQHGPNEFFLALGTLFLTRIGRGRRYAALSALAYAAAVACRPTSAVVVVAVGVYLLAAHRRTLAVYLLAGLPVAVVLGGYNTYYLGEPWALGQSAEGQAVARSKTGREGLWQTPLWKGAAGLLMSPSRGLLVFSPFMGFAMAGMVAFWRNRTYAVFRPLSIAVALLMALAFKWFDWWGGWCFGYRPIVDTMPLLALGLIPMIDVLARRRRLAGLFALLVGWSVMVQVLGAFAYNLDDWNNRIVWYAISPTDGRRREFAGRKELEAFVGANPGWRGGREMLDVDRPEYRHRLWSVSDSQILYYLRHFQDARRLKHEQESDWLKNPWL